MRQGGLSPKGHNSGVYWTRVASKKKQKKEEESTEKFSPIDLDHDGVVTPDEIKVVIGIYIVTVVCGLGLVSFLIYLAILGLKP
jgi:hypothetical protein